jgi:hypothetical protein
MVQKWVLATNNFNNIDNRFLEFGKKRQNNTLNPNAIWFLLRFFNKIYSLKSFFIFIFISAIYRQIEIIFG